MTYDQWKTDPGRYGYDEPEEEGPCPDCADAGYVIEYDGDIERLVMCRCSMPLDVWDMDDWVAPNQVGCPDGRDDRPGEQQGGGVPGQADPREAC